MIIKKKEDKEERNNANTTDNFELDLLLVEPASTRRTDERAGFPPGTPPKLKSIIVYAKNNNKAVK